MKSNKLAPEKLNEIINDVIVEWAVEELKYYKERAAKIPSATGAGKRDISVELLKATANNIAIVSFAFHDYMRYREMRNYDTSHFPLDEAIKWIEAKGVNKFIAKYQKLSGRKSLPSDNTKLLNQIAWGIIRGKRRNRRPRHWYNRRKWKGINILWQRILDDIGDAILQNMKTELLK